MPLGLEDGTIKDHQITASSHGVIEDPLYRPPWEGRLHNDNYWYGRADGKKDKVWIQIDFLHEVEMIGILVQGAGNRAEDLWVTEVKIETGNDVDELEKGRGDKVRERGSKSLIQIKILGPYA